MCLVLGMLDVTRVLKERSKEMTLKHHVKMTVTPLIHIHNNLTTLFVQCEIILRPTRKYLRETFLVRFRPIFGQTLL